MAIYVRDPNTGNYVNLFDPNIFTTLATGQVTIKDGSITENKLAFKTAKDLGFPTTVITSGYDIRLDIDLLSIPNGAILFISGTGGWVYGTLFGGFHISFTTPSSIVGYEYTIRRGGTTSSGTSLPVPIGINSRGQTFMMTVYKVNNDVFIVGVVGWAFDSNQYAIFSIRVSAASSPLYMHFISTYGSSGPVFSVNGRVLLIE